MNEILTIKEFHVTAFQKINMCKICGVHACKCKCSDDFCVDYARVCSEHFAVDDLEHDLRVELLNLKFRKHLKTTAVLHIKIPVFSTNIGRCAKAQELEFQ